MVMCHSGTNLIKLMSWTWQNSFNWVETSSPTQLDLTNLPATLLSWYRWWLVGILKEAEKFFNPTQPQELLNCIWCDFTINGVIFLSCNKALHEVETLLFEWVLVALEYFKEFWKDAISAVSACPFAWGEHTLNGTADACTGKTSSATGNMRE